jgi:hypothetical protein
MSDDEGLERLVIRNKRFAQELADRQRIRQLENHVHFMREQLDTALPTIASLKDQIELLHRRIEALTIELHVVGLPRSTQHRPSRGRR